MRARARGDTHKHTNTHARTAFKLRPTLDPRKCPPEAARFIEMCWATRADARPTFAQVETQRERKR